MTNYKTITCNVDAFPKRINQSFPFGLFVRMPAKIQQQVFNWAMRNGNFYLAWDLADHANHNLLDVDSMMQEAALRGAEWRLNDGE